MTATAGFCTGLTFEKNHAFSTTVLRLDMAIERSSVWGYVSMVEDHDFLMECERKEEAWRQV